MGRDSKTVTAHRRLLAGATVVFLLAALVRPLAESTPQKLPFAQDWSNAGLIVSLDNWSGVPGIMGFRGDNLTTLIGADPQSILADGAMTPINVLANQTSPNTLATGGVAEFAIADPTIALQGSGTADAPFILINLDTTGAAGVRVSYNVRDIDGSADNAAQPVALQYRVGQFGSFTNVPEAFIADATDGPSLATRVTPVSVLLPPAVNNRPVVQLRIMTANAAGSDEWVGIDDIQVVAETPTGGLQIKSTGASPDPSWTGDEVLLTASIGPAESPASTGIAVTGDLTALGGPISREFRDDGTAGDRVAGDLVFSLLTNAGIASGERRVPITAADAEGRSVHGSIALTVLQAPAATPIHEIQGEGSTSPKVGQWLTTAGVVTALKSNGFFIQSADAEADSSPLTSEGLFVYQPGGAGVSLGQRVRVSGTVAEFVPAADPGSPPMTELINPSVSVIGSNQPLPEPQPISPADVHAGAGPEPLERFEGMRVRADALTVVAPTGGFKDETLATSTSDGVFYAVMPGVARPFREPGIEAGDPVPAEAAAPASIPRFDANPERIRVETGFIAPLDVAAGDTVTGVIGVVDYRYRAYTILTYHGAPPARIAAAAPAPVRAAEQGEFTVASFNLERFYDATDDAGISDGLLTVDAVNRRLAKASLAIRHSLSTPDIVAVQEVENLTILQALADRLNADTTSGLPAAVYQAHLVEGHDVGGIDVGYLVNTVRASVLGVEQLETNPPVTYTNPASGAAELLNDRPPLVLRARVHTPPYDPYDVTIVNNHLRSMSGIDGADGLRVRTKRRAQAEFLAAAVAARRAADPAERIVVVGDLNAFEFSDGLVDSVGTIKGNPAPPALVAQASPDLVTPDLLNLVELLPGSERYSYVFEGSAQSLDHVLVSGNLSATLQHARLNADFPEAYRGDASRPERLSDHDPLVAFVRMPRPDLEAPVLTVPGDFTVEATASLTPVTFVVTAVDAVEGPVAPYCSMESGSLFALGSTTVTCHARDSRQNTATASFVVTVVDTTPPAMYYVGASPASLWPPDHRMVPVAVSATVHDKVSEAVCRIVGVSSNEPAADAWVFSGLSLQLRAERRGNGTGRIYTIDVGCSDAGGNMVTGRTTVTVAHDSGVPVGAALNPAGTQAAKDGKAVNGKR